MVEPIPADFLVVGAGIAGASLAYWLAPHGRTVLLERESQPGYHATGRSAAQYIASYGTPQVRALTLASRGFFDRPPQDFADGPLLTPRPTLTVAAPGQEALLDEAWQVARTASPRAERWSPAQACRCVPVLRPAQVIGAVWQPEAFDIDVHALHQGYLRGARRAGATLECEAEVSAVTRTGPRWRAGTRDGRAWAAPVLVNAAGAWCDVVARMAGVAPLGLVPRRRAAFTFAPPEDLPVKDWPLVIAVDESWYFKPDAGVLFGSPANADPTEPQDVQPEDLDIALGMDRIETHTTMAVRPIRAWAGLRSFVHDGDLVGGFATDAPGFFWLAAQGGYGIQTSPAMGQACAALVTGASLPGALAAYGFDAASLSPARLGRDASSPIQPLS